MDNVTRNVTIGLFRWNTDYSKQAGVTTIALALAQAWQQLGCQIFWIGSAPPSAIAHRLTWIDCPPTTPGLIQGVYRALAQEPIDLFVTFEPFTEGPAAATVKAQTGIPFVHLGMHFANNEDPQASHAEMFTYRSADMIVYQCRWFLNHYIAPKFGPAFAEHKPSIVVPFGVDTTIFSPRPPTVKAPDRPILLFNGRLNQENCAAPEYDKGAHYLITAIPKLVQHYSNLKVIVVGNGPQLPQLQAIAQASEITQHVTFLGEVDDRHRLIAHLQQASIFVLPSVCDVFPVAIVEAMASGLPIVSTTVGGIPECVHAPNGTGETGEACGILVEPARSDLLAHAILKLLSNSALRQQMGQQAREKATSEYDWSVAASKTLVAFYNLLGQR